MRTAELFAGVGGFRVGLDRAGGYDTVWANQWEPDGRVTKQFAYRCYESHFGDGSCVNNDISRVLDSMEAGDVDVPDIDLLTAGFPCQDYSIAKPLHLSKGMRGPKGVLWWQICRAMTIMDPEYAIFENVDRLLTSPASNHGRDFSVILSSLSELGYEASWRVVRASDYGYPTKRTRVFILASRSMSANDLFECMGRAFPFDGAVDKVITLGSTAYESSSTWRGYRKSPFLSCGILAGSEARTGSVTAVYDGDAGTLGDVLLPSSEIPDERWISSDALERWEYLKGAKRENRIAKNGHEYVYSEGAMAFPDLLDRPARTMTTSEGGGPSRMTHVVMQDGRYRRLMPEEAEAMMGFDCGWTNTGMSQRQRFFCLGNALVTGLVERIGRSLNESLEK